MKIVSFTKEGVRSGFWHTLPLAPSIAAYGALFGMLAEQQGLSFAEACLMSATVFAGASQLIILPLWVDPLPILTITFTVIVVNLRHILIGASLHPWMKGLPWIQNYTSVALMCDESWALTVKEFSRGNRNAAFLLGSGTMCYLAWNLAGIIGYLSSGTIQDPSHWGLDFAFLAVFIALLCVMGQSKKDVVPLVTAATSAIVSHELIGGHFYILIGAITGSLVGALRGK